MQPPNDSSDEFFIQTSPEFKKDVRRLKKKYRHIKRDIEPIIERLQGGQLIGDQIAGTDYIVYKVRVRNSDIQKGKSAGYRIIYQLESSVSIVLIKIYSKSDRDDISIRSIQKIISDTDQADR